MKKKLLSIVLTICMVASTLTVTSVTAVAAETADTDVKYLYPVYNVTTGTDFEQASSGIKEWKKGTLTSSEYTVYNGQTTLNSGWYVVNGTFNLSSTITVSGDVHLVLCDGSSLKVETSGEPYGPGIAVTSGNSLSVYAQSTDDDTMGKLTALGNGNSAGIGGYFYEEGEANSGKITINGGNVTAENAGYGYGAGIGGGLGGSGKNITINGGNITAYGSWRAPAIGGGGDMYYENVQGSAQYITINGGVIYARGNDQDEIAIGAGANDSFEYGSAKDIKIADCLEVTADDKVLTHADDMAQSLSGKYAIDIAPYICYIDANNNGIFDLGDTKFSRLAQATTFASSTPSTLRLITNVVQRLIISDNEDITLDLDGYTLSTEGNYWDYFVIDNVGKLKIIDSNTAGQTHYFTVNANGLWVLSDDITAEAKAAAVAYEDLTDTPKTGDVIAVYGGCVTGGRGMYVEGEYHGGGIYNKGSLVILDGSIIGNTAEYGAGVYNREDASLTIGGEAVIDYNIATVLGDNVMTYSPFDLATGDDAPTSGMKVGVTLVDDNKSVAGKFTTNAAKTDANYFFSDNDDYVVLYNAGEYLELGKIPEEVKDATYSASLTLSKNIDIKFAMGNIASDESDKLTITVDGEPVEYKYAQEEGKETYKATCVLKAVKPNEIGESIHVVVTFNDAKIKDFNYSVKAYCNAVYDHQSYGPDSDLGKLCTAILNYGKYAEDYVNGDTSSVVNLGHEIDFSKVTLPESQSSITPSATYGSADSVASLALGSTVKLNYLVKTSEFVYELDPQNFFIINEDNKQIDPEKISVSEVDGGYLISVDLYAYQLANRYTLKVKDVALTKFQITLGVYDYCADVQGLTGPVFTDTLKTLCKAVYTYGEAVKNYTK